MKKRYGFTMIELVFVIVVLGILAAVAIPRMAATRDDAQVAKGRSDVAAVRSGIVSERQTRLLQGQSTYAPALDDSGEPLFSNVMLYGVQEENANGHWRKSGSSYIFKIMNTDVSFDYNVSNGTFTCARSTTTAGELCKDLID